MLFSTCDLLAQLFMLNANKWLFFFNLAVIFYSNLPYCAWILDIRSYTILLAIQIYNALQIGNIQYEKN